VQEAPFIFNLYTADFQEVRVQGQISFRIVDPEKTGEMLNFNLTRDAGDYVSEDPLKLQDHVVRAAQAIAQNALQQTSLRQALGFTQTLTTKLKQTLNQQQVLSSLGIELTEATVTSINASPETSRALEAEAREAILQEADDALYARRKSSVEQERTIKTAELETELSVQRKEQEIEESRVANERAIMRATAETKQEQLHADINEENQRKTLVSISAENRRQEADVEAYAIRQRMQAFRELPVENLKAMDLSGIQADQMLALAFESLAENAGKIGELNITPDLFTHSFNKALNS
jgi:regulator of protease activity HflC (stomatin/prohibitin superfamily)